MERTVEYPGKPITKRNGPGAALGPSLRSCEVKLLSCIRKDWALEFGSRQVCLVIEYQDNVPVLIRVTENAVKEEKLK